MLMSENGEAVRFTGKEEVNSDHPVPFVVPKGTSLPAVMRIPHLMYPDAFQRSPGSFYVAVEEDDEGNRTSLLAVRPKPEETESQDL